MLVWTVMPATSHAPTIFETLQEHAEMIAEHGHSHGLEDDLAWAMHGHGHDSADHDHSQAVLTRDLFPQPFEDYATAWQLGAVPAGPSMAAGIERPPRA
ncbi:hypothetical protein [uncultured Jannaschia sp.]|uniref:hypothetical protein n=1 Tax=uncultured Jannaschia sp. TaxID=293347 RepID=UPI002620140C|nr:hypothetical protein [uncultured Jannaschia sp.]